MHLKTSWRARGEEEIDNAVWRHHLTSDPQGKPNGWHGYDTGAGAEVEELYRQWAIDGNADMAVRCVHAASSGFTASPGEDDPDEHHLVQVPFHPPRHYRLTACTRLAPQACTYVLGGALRAGAAFFKLQQTCSSVTRLL